MTIKINTKFNANEIRQELREADDIRGNVHEHIMNLRDQGVREALTKLGWTPPGEDSAQVENWKEAAAQYARNADFYQGIVRQIGEMFGEEARTSDDGSVQDDVLALKVPELVEALVAHVLDIGEYMKDQWPGAYSKVFEKFGDLAPETSLARRDLLKQAEVLEEAGRYIRCEEDAALLRINAQELRRQAEGGEA